MPQTPPPLESGVFYLCKPVDLIQRYLNLSLQPRFSNIVELGILRGGSTALLQLLLGAEKFLAMELSPDRIPELDTFIETEKLSGRLRAEYGVNQGDSARLLSLCDDHFGENCELDVVFDDASHLLDLTRTSFEALFPRIKAGGAYIVEDYAAAQLAISADYSELMSERSDAAEIAQKIVEHSLQDDKRPIHLLAVEAMLASIIAPDIVREVIVDNQWLKIVRGPKRLDGESFALRNLCADSFGLLQSSKNPEIWYRNV